MFTLLKDNEHFLSWKGLKNIVAKEDIALAGAISSFVTMFSNADVKTSIYGVKGYSLHVFVLYVVLSRL